LVNHEFTNCYFERILKLLKSFHRFNLITKKKASKQKSFDAVKTFRDIKAQISSEIKYMIFEQLKKYLSDLPMGNVVINKKS
jgi:hypothetical protein